MLQTHLQKMMWTQSFQECNWCFWCSCSYSQGVCCENCRRWGERLRNKPSCKKESQAQLNHCGRVLLNAHVTCDKAFWKEMHDAGMQGSFKGGWEGLPTFLCFAADPPPSASPPCTAFLFLTFCTGIQIHCQLVLPIWTHLRLALSLRKATKQTKLQKKGSSAVESLWTGFTEYISIIQISCSMAVKNIHCDLSGYLWSLCGSASHVSDVAYSGAVLSLTHDGMVFICGFETGVTPAQQQTMNDLALWLSEFNVCISNGFSSVSWFPANKTYSFLATPLEQTWPWPNERPAKASENWYNRDKTQIIKGPSCFFQKWGV